MSITAFCTCWASSWKNLKVLRRCRTGPASFWSLSFFISSFSVRSKSSLPITRNWQGPLQVTEAERGLSSRSAVSPKKEPGPSVAMCTPNVSSGPGRRLAFEATAAAASPCAELMVASAMASSMVFLPPAADLIPTCAAGVAGGAWPEVEERLVVLEERREGASSSSTLTSTVAACFSERLAVEEAEGERPCSSSSAISRGSTTVTRLLLRPRPGAAPSGGQGELGREVLRDAAGDSSSSGLGQKDCLDLDVGVRSLPAEPPPPGASLGKASWCCLPEVPSAASSGSSSTRVLTRTAPFLFLPDVDAARWAAISAAAFSSCAALSASLSRSMLSMMPHCSWASMLPSEYRASGASSSSSSSISCQIMT
mmetsp:Transcript_123902/g.300863  ORF Transcript_123902/g.300863 Transcript_123902/m.300863 type:complete len:368 (-) Transcript_123902:182-1285(-)